MTWETPLHTKCPKPLFNLASSGSIWRCDAPGCGKRWRMTRTIDGAGKQSINWKQI